MQYRELLREWPSYSEKASFQNLGGSQVSDGNPASADCISNDTYTYTFNTLGTTNVIQAPPRVISGSQFNSTCLSII